MAWTEDRVELLKKLWMEGLSARTTSRVSRPRPRKPRAPSTPGQNQMFRAAGNTALKADQTPKPSYRPEPQPAPIQEVHIPPGERIGVLQLSDKTCRWPIGDPGEQDFHFCGRKPQSGLPYCTYHTSIAYQPLQDRRRQKRALGGRR
jgi:GcrA cell cycle regulator